MSWWRRVLFASAASSHAGACGTRWSRRSHPRLGLSPLVCSAASADGFASAIRCLIADFPTGRRGRHHRIHAR
jgi:hypothetical protein